MQGCIKFQLNFQRVGNVFEMMQQINKSPGLTETERYLAKVCERTFLSLWSYPNLYREAGKELCDLLVVFDRHILIFSDKDICFNLEVMRREFLQRDRALF